MFPITITLTIADEATLARAIASLESIKAKVDAAPASAPPPKADKPKAKPVELTKTQTEAMDETAGLGNAQPSPATPARTERTASEAKADAPAPKAISYAELQAAVLKLHKADSTAAAPIAQGMGFANFKAMPEDKWPEALVKVQEALSEKGVV